MIEASYKRLAFQGLASLVYAVSNYSDGLENRAYVYFKQFDYKEHPPPHEHPLFSHSWQVRHIHVRSRHLCKSFLCPILSPGEIFADVFLDVASPSISETKRTLRGNVREDLKATSLSRPHFFIGEWLKDVILWRYLDCSHIFI